MLTLLLWQGVASATSLQNVTIDEQATDSDLVIEGQVDRQWFELPAVENAFIVTRSHVIITHEFKGHVVSGEVLLTTPGGYYPDGSHDQVPGTPAVGVGDHVIAHLKIVSDGAIVRLQNWTGGLLLLGDNDSQAILDAQGRLLTITADGLLLPIADQQFEDAIDAPAARALVESSIEATGSTGSTIAGYSGGTP